MIGLFGMTLPAQAMQFDPVTISASAIAISGRGEIVGGDTARLGKVLAAVPPGKRLLGLSLDSPGGMVVEGERLAHLIRVRGLSVLIPSHSQCASACFLLLAASPSRFAAVDALVGVHSVSENGKETDTSLAVTTLMARDAAELGVPPAIIGKMVETTPGRIEWLTRADLVSMDVTMLDGDAPDGRPARTAPAAPAPAPMAVPAAMPAPASPSAPAPAVVPAATPDLGFAAGAGARRAWDAWMAGLRGLYRDGAGFALAQIGVTRPVSCRGPNAASLGDFTLGCEAARQRLAPVEANLRGHPDYSAGWNGTVPGGAPNEPVEAEYQGAYFCGRQVARLTLKVFARPGAPRRRALFSFGPQPASPEVPSGAFLVEGAIDAKGGALTLTPVQWVSRPAGYSWLGLSGRSGDGGRTFSGQVTGAAGCSAFTLRIVIETMNKQ
jgi:hypothetical protein